MVPMWSWTKKSRQVLQEREALLELRTAFHDLTLQVKQLEESLAALEGKHERLRGRFYATREPPPATDKASILAAYRRGEIKP